MRWQVNWYIPFTLVFLFLAHPTVGQYYETIRTGRPGQSIGPFTTGTGILQVQSGMDMLGNSVPATAFLNNTVIRYGITETFEVSALVNYIFYESTALDGSDKTNSGLQAMDVGIRYHIIDGDGKWLPDIGFQIRLRLPVLSEDYKINHVAPRFTIVTSNPIGKFTIVTNSGAVWNGMDAKAKGFYIINLSWPFSAKLSGFVENYAAFANGPTEIFWDGGLGWLLTPDLQLDLYGGYAVNHGIKTYFTSIGVSIRTKRN